MFLMYDSVNVDVIPDAPHAVLGYVNGDFVTVPALERRFPELDRIRRIARLSVHGIEPHHGYDIEKGDYRPDQAGELLRVAHEAGIWRPLFYADLSNMPAVEESLRPVAQQLHIPREGVRLLVAEWDGVAEIPIGFDGKQFTNHALGRSLDESICADNFFQPAGKPQPPAHRPASDRLLRAIVEVDPDSNSWGIHTEPPTTTGA